jgi:hypothetical protein
MRKKAAFICLLLLTTVYSFSQLPTIKGSIRDTADNKNLQNAVVSVLKKADTTLVSFTRTDKNGTFTFNGIDTGKYVILITYPRFADYMESLIVTGNTDIGSIFITPKSKLLDEVVIRTGSAIRIKGDTTEFTADSFKVKEGGTVEDLLKKLPGFTVNAKGEIIAQGKRVDKVLVDGEEFFGDDPTMATQNISAKAVDKVQVFETKTEQQQLTGITTGSEGKTVNIKLKEDAKKGSFGKINAGTDFSKYMENKGLYNRFVGKKKSSVYLTRTNINAGSLSWEDRQKLGIENDYEYDELSGYYFSFGGGDEFNDWSLRGLPDAWAGGALFTNKWKEDKHNVNISYRYNSLGTTNTGSTLSQNILPTGLTYSNNYSTKKGLNRQHAFNGKYEWKLDSLASLKLTTVNTFKKSNTQGNTISEFLNANRDTINRSFRDYDNNTNRMQTDNQLTWKQLFKKKNRVLQTVARFGITEDENDGINNSTIRYFSNGIFNYADTLDQLKLFDGQSTTMGIKSTFTEPLSVKWMLVVDYAYNKNHSVSRRNTFEKNITDKYEVLVPDFSNNFTLDAFSHSGNALIRYAGTKIKIAMGSGLSNVKLNLQNLDSNKLSNFNFLRVTPQVQFNFLPKAQTNIGINYRGTTRQPTINQLQPLRDNTDPLNEYIGNPDLKVGFNHNISIFFNQYKVLAQRGIWANFSYNIQNNAITQYNTVDVATGKKSYYPVNVNGNTNWNFWTNWNKGTGENKPSYGISFNGNGGRFINFINSQKAITDYAAVNFEFSFDLEFKDKFSLSLSPKAGYNSSKSSLSSSIDNNYFTYGGDIDMALDLPWKMEISTELDFDLRQKINAFATNTNLVLWKAGLSKKIFKKDTGKITLYANDILNDNIGFTRTINNTFISDERFQRISRYFLLKFEWSFNKMPGEEKK